MPDRLVVLYRGSLPPATGLIEQLADTVYATEEELPLLLPGADALLAWVTITPAIRVSWPDNPDKAPRWVHASSAGGDSFLFPALVDDPGVTLTNARGVYDQPTAEYVLGLILALAKDFPGTWEHQQRREWRPRPSDTITGRTALVWGTGPIGRAIARLLRGAGMRVQGVGRSSRTDPPRLRHRARPRHSAFRTGRGGLRRPRRPLTKDTRGMVDASVLTAVKPGARLINVGRGALVGEKALIDHLTDGRLAGAALDVFNQEPLPADSPLWDMPGVIISPHTAGETTGEREALIEVFLDNLTRHNEGRPLCNVVDKRRGYVVDEPHPG
jgi:phosphoglycerate dehydrogenase-like enzyme